ncbi:MAG: J domain-containing protein [Bryobacteraceae bacterium]
MQPVLAQVRQRITQSLDAQPELTLILDSNGGPSSRLKARFLAGVGDGMKIRVTTALGSGVLVSVAGEIVTSAGRAPVLGYYRVRACTPQSAGTYHAELYPEPVAKEPPPSQPATKDLDLDCYEVLQVSRQAEIETIHRIFHVLAQRYHPDNSKSGDEERFRQLVHAHAVLTDPERRAAHDVRLADEDKGRMKLFDALQASQGVPAEIRKRQAILRLLYTKRLTNPHQPEMRGRDFVEMLGCPLEHLEFSIWFLRENKLILRADNNKFEITCQGVEAFEAEETSFSKKPVLKLTAPASVPA